MFSHSDICSVKEKFTNGECSLAGYRPGSGSRDTGSAMNRALKTYLDSERGRASRLADALNVSRSYVSDLANGKKPGSIDVMRRIAELTGIPAADLLDTATPGGLSDEATRYEPAPIKPGNSLDAYLAPNIRHRATFRVNKSAPWLGIHAGDVLVIDMRNAPRLGDVVLASVLTGNDAETRVLRYLPPHLVSGDPSESPIPEAAARVQGPVVALARGPGL